MQSVNPNSVDIHGHKSLGLNGAGKTGQGTDSEVALRPPHPSYPFQAPVRHLDTQRLEMETSKKPLATFYITPWHALLLLSAFALFQDGKEKED